MKLLFLGSLMENEYNRNYGRMLAEKIKSPTNLGQDKTKDRYDSFMGFIQK